MNRHIISFALCALTSASAYCIEVSRTFCDYRPAPMAVSSETPRFGWQLSGNDGDMQSAYEIEVYSGKGKPAGYVWKSGKVNSGNSQHIVYSGNPLTPGNSYSWRVRVWDQDGKASGWSEPASFRMAPDTHSIGAKWIGAVSYDDARLPEGRNYTSDKWKKPEIKEKWDAVDTMASRSIMLRKEFPARDRITDATVYVCGLGHYELDINGKKVGDSEFAPLWSDYDRTVYYNSYDVTPMLEKGDNAMGVTLGNGFYNVVRGDRYSKLQVGFGPETLWLGMIVNYADGSSDTIVSDDTWKYALSPVTFNTIYGGEDYDARMEQPGWSRPAFDDSAWRPVVVQRAPKGQLTAQAAPPVKIMERYGVKSVHKLTADEVERASKSTKRTVDPSAVLLDMGQNLAGFPEITVKGRRGQKITLVVAEAVNEDSAASQRQTGRQHFYTYTLKSDKPETWHPRFSYYGFRYIQLEGAVLKGEPNPDNLPVVEDIKSCFVYNSAAEGSEFESSSEVYTAAHRLIRNAVRSNMQSVFTDCPHREKLGWLEQVHLNGPGLLYNYDLTTYLPKVMRDISDSQRADGMVPTVAPQYVVFEGPGVDVFSESPEWAATLVVAPWMYYETYGDDSLLREYYPEMKAYVDYLTTRADSTGLIDFGLGDWYDYGDFRAGFSRNTPVGLVASAHYIMDLDLVAKTAQMLGHTDDSAKYRALADKVSDAFNSRYFDPLTGSYTNGSQCANALPLFLDIVPQGKKAEVLKSLVDDIRKHGNRLTTGDVGNRYLFRALSDNGLDSLMWAMTDHYDTPGYGFQLKFGATTLTEQWDPRQGSSWNHFMMGQIDEWLFRSLLGIRPDPSDPGYRHIIFKPSPVGNITYAKGKTSTLYGDVRAEWRRDADTMTIDIDIPVNTTGTVIMPDGSAREIKSGHSTISGKI